MPPVPGDTVVVFSAYLVGRGTLGWLPVYVATCLGGTAGFTLMYYIGRTRGRAFLAGRRGTLFAPERLARAEVWLARYGPWLILANRFLSGVRSVIALVAGIGGMGWGPVVGLGLVSMALWNAALLYAGMLMGQNWGAVTRILEQYDRVVLVAGGLAAGALLWRRLRRPRG
ncbi:MAG: DedA family protein [Gemmatimonadota bacterium]